jgi:hypothetical protein
MIVARIFVRLCWINEIKEGCMHLLDVEARAAHFGKNFWM